MYVLRGVLTVTHYEVHVLRDVVTRCPPPLTFCTSPLRQKHRLLDQLLLHPSYKVATPSPIHEQEYTAYTQASAYDYTRGISLTVSPHGRNTQ